MTPENQARAERIIQLTHQTGSFIEAVRLADEEWAVDVKGDRNGWEIGVTKKSFRHGWKSLGWKGEEKEILFCSTLYCTTPCPQWIFGKMVEIAHLRCAELNEQAAQAQTDQAEV